MTEIPPHPMIRDASSVILLRDRTSNPRILVGQRGKNAAFMPNKFVFPGGAVDPNDSDVRLRYQPAQLCLSRLNLRCQNNLTEELLTCAVREVWEETGLRLARKSDNELIKLPTDWGNFSDGELFPSAAGLVFMFRAITPPGRPRRFDARFFLADLDRIDLATEPDDFSHASDELAHLHWTTLAEVCRLDLPTITRRVIARVNDLLMDTSSPDKVPFSFTKDGKRLIEYL